MVEIITLIVICSIWGYCIVTDTKEKKKEEAFYKRKITEYSIKGDLDKANYYTEKLVRLK